MIRFDNFKNIKASAAYKESSDEQIHKEPTLSHVRTLADKLLELEDVFEVESLIDEEPLFLKLAYKLAKSKQVISSIKEPFHVSVVHAMYGETRRMKPPQEDELGEDFINVKIDQLHWLFEDAQQWSYFLVDDGCPEESGRAAEKIVQEKKEDISVLYLENAIKDDLIENLRSTRESKKGGSIRYGLLEANKKSFENHYIIYTDADLSTDLGQIGLLVEKLREGYSAVAGSRREPDSVVVKKGMRNTRGKLFIYLWKRLFPQLSNIVDSQCAFKGFRAAVIPTIIADPLEHGFAFDLELLLKLDTSMMTSIGIAWIDSEEGSTTGDPYLEMLKKLSEIYQKKPQGEESDAFAQFIRNLKKSDWDLLVQRTPQSIAQRDPRTINASADVTVEELDNIINTSR